MTASGTATTETAEVLSFRGKPMTVRRAGRGTTVGFLHGMLGTPPGHPLLAAAGTADREIVAPCLPGFSGSAPCADLRTIYDWVVATSEAIDMAGLNGGPVVACSVGAMLALEVAAVRPEAFSHLVLVAPFGLWADDDPVADPFATTLSVQRRMLTADPTVTASFFDDPADLGGDDLIEFGVDRYHTRAAAASLIWPIPEHGLAERLHRVTTPVTLVWGADDAILPISYLDRFADLLPNVAGRHVIDGAGHLAAWDAPEAVADVMVEAGV